MTVQPHQPSGFILAAVVALLAAISLTGCGSNDGGSGAEDNQHRCLRITAILDDPTGPDPSADDGAFWLKHCDATQGSDGAYVG
jgi:hypothetical protein